MKRWWRIRGETPETKRSLTSESVREAGQKLLEQGFVASEPDWVAQFSVPQIESESGEVLTPIGLRVEGGNLVVVVRTKPSHRSFALEVEQTDEILGDAGKPWTKDRDGGR